MSKGFITIQARSRREQRGIICNTTSSSLGVTLVRGAER
jgi:hypothetical protein